MRIAFSNTKDHILFLTEDAKEYKRLYSFPALLKSGATFYIPAKGNVLHNVVSRLRKAKFKINMDVDVYDFMSLPFKLKEIPESFKFHTTPMDYQLIALRYMFTVGSGGLLLDPGMGKSKVVLDYIHLMGFKKTLIVCPKSLLFVWEDEIATHRPELSFYTVKTTDWESEVGGIRAADVVVINYNKAVTFRTNLSEIGFQFIHLDEFLIKDPKTDRTKELTKLSSAIPYRCGGSGTLINNSVADVFCPVRYLEPSLVGMNYMSFFNEHVVTRVVSKTDGDIGHKQVVGWKGLNVARSILESCSIVMTKDEWLKQLPEKKFHDIIVSMSPEQKDAYYYLQRNKLVTVNGVMIEVDNPLVEMSKLYQISNGFIYNSPPEEQKEEINDLMAEESRKRKRSKRTTLYFNENPKIEALRNLLTGTIRDRRAIIWFNMEAEYVQISKMLEEIGHSFSTIRGGEKDTGNKVRKFNQDPSIKWLVCQAKSVNYGITVLGTTLEKLEETDFPVFPGISPEVHTEVFFSMNFSLEVYLQQQDRIHRLGQKHQCDYYRIFSNSPVEKKIRMALQDKMSLRWEMLVDVAKTLLSEEDGDAPI